MSEHDELMKEWLAVHERVRLSELSPAEKFEELKRAYLDAKRRGEDPEKALQEKYKELNPEEEPEPTSKTPPNSGTGSGAPKS